MFPDPTPEEIAAIARVREKRVADAREKGLLTQDEVDALPDGTVAEIIWGGGNGPHRYEVRHRDGASYALLTADHPDYAGEQQDWTERRMMFRYARIENVGGDQRDTWVRLPTDASWPHRPLTWRSDGKTNCPACGGECKFADHEHNRQFVSKGR